MQQPSKPLEERAYGDFNKKQLAIVKLQQD